MLSAPCCQHVGPVCSQQMFPISSGQQMEVGRRHASVSHTCTRGKFLLSLSLSGLSEGKKEEVRGILLGSKCHGLCSCSCSFSLCYLFAAMSQRTGMVWGIFHPHVTSLRLTRSLLNKVMTAWQLLDGMYKMRLVSAQLLGESNT